MYISLFLFQSTDAPSWFSDNAGWLLTLFTLLIAGIVWAVRQEGLIKQLMAQIDELKKAHGKLDDDFYGHAADQSAHVNHLYMRSLENRIEAVDKKLDRFEVTMNDQFKQSMSKMDEILLAERRRS